MTVGRHISTNSDTLSNVNSYFYPENVQLILKSKTLRNINIYLNYSYTISIFYQFLEFYRSHHELLHPGGGGSNHLHTLLPTPLQHYSLHLLQHHSLHLLHLLHQHNLQQSPEARLQQRNDKASPRRLKQGLLKRGSKACYKITLLTVAILFLFLFFQFDLGCTSHMQYMSCRENISILEAK
jgi:hypothetical protein